MEVFGFPAGFTHDPSKSTDSNTDFFIIVSVSLLDTLNLILVDFKGLNTGSVQESK